SHFINKFNNLHKKSVLGLTGQAMDILFKHNWPGNIRELENVVEHAFVIEGSERITPQSLPSYLRGGLGPSVPGASLNPIGAGADSPLVPAGLEQNLGPEELLDYKSHKEQFEKEFIIKALKTFKGRINQTAMHAKIPKKTLLRKLQKYGI